MKPVPESKYDEIIQELNEISNHIDKRPFAFKLNRFKDEANRIISIEPKMAYTILGIIACFENDLEAMHKYHQNAIKLSGESSYALSQYSASLAKQGLLEQAYTCAHKAYEKTKEDRDILIKLMNLAYSLKKIDDYEFFKKMLIKLRFDFHDPDEFLEDSDEFLQNAFGIVDKMIENHPELTIEPDPEFEAFVDDLVEGVDIS